MLELPRPTPFLILLASTVSCDVPSFVVPVTVIVYLYPFVTLSLVTLVTVILLFEGVKSLACKLYILIPDSLSVHVSVTEDVPLF